MIKLSPRERNIFVVVVVLVGFWALYALAIGPLLDERSDLDTNINTASQSLDQAHNLVHRAQVDSAKWKEMQRYGLRNDAAAAESQMLHAIEDWARDAGLTMTGNKPDRAEAEKPFQKITFHVTTTGNLAGINRFMWDVETSMIPTRVEEFNVTARKEGTDDLSLSVAISTLCIVPPTTKPSDAVAEVQQ